MNAHTPGPWKAQKPGAMATKIISESRTLATAWRDGGDGLEDLPHEANAHLIAAAPTMSAALQNAAYLLAELPASAQTPKMLSLRGEIVAAIKMATPEYYGEAS